ncbi:IspD/TarI family cytidylyltransferase [Nocardia amamiensis]|uniref:IspD/TarI family cytidylyltransferase n=1 Tax=Nocardia amamiensis TaxID=404578 RepID=UPI0009FE5F59|nr:IspD/TarI family cytidylyltransferase [Nocardia amamiensis]
MGMHTSSGAAAVVLAAGTGSRMGTDGNKAYLPIAGLGMVSWTLEAVRAVPEFTRTLLVTRIVDLPNAAKILDREVPDLDVEVIVGGASRHESEYHALQHLAPAIEAGTIDTVVIHDAARPLAGAEMMRMAVSTARRFGGAVPALAVDDVVTIHPDGNVTDPGFADQLVRVQTPQAFRAKPLLEAYRAAELAGFEGTDTSASVERFTDLRVRIFPGDERNIKVTYAHDLFLAERLLTEQLR